VILYLGLDPSHFAHEGPLFHYPVIRTRKLPLDPNVRRIWPQITHVIFTSRTAVRYWWEEEPEFGKRAAIAIGSGTTGELTSRGMQPLVAPEALQEGVAQLLDTLDLSHAHILLPHSALARPFLRAYLAQRCAHFAFPLYETVLQRLEPVPSLENIAEIVFTSPSTVTGFLKIYGKIPRHVRCKTIGPITQEALLKISRLG